MPGLGGGEILVIALVVVVVFGLGRFRRKPAPRPPVVEIPAAAPEPVPPPAPRVRPRLRTRFLLLWLAGLVSVVLVLPYALALQRPLLEGLPVSLPQLLLLSTVQSAVLLAVAVFLGLRAADAVGLRTPLTDAIAARSGARAAFRALRPVSSAVVGAIVALVILGLEGLVFRPLLPEFNAAVAGVAPSRWEGFLASFYGGIGEELLTRLFLVSVLGWIMRGRAFLVAVLLAALLFAAGHLPAAAAISPLTTALIVRTLVLNSLAGVAFGWLYGRRGLEAAMIAHFSADIVLHVVAGA